jgi:hypothetical protein
VLAVANQGVAVIRLDPPLTALEAAVVWRRHERPSPVLSRFLRAAPAPEEPDRLGLSWLGATPQPWTSEG